jgi:cyanophycinase
MSILKSSTAAATALMVLAFLVAGSSKAAEVGPDSGRLVIVGGGGNIESILEEFIDLAGGPTAPIVVIPTASGASTYDQFHRSARWFREHGGVEDVTVLHTNDRAEADREAFVEPIRRARGVWFSGGRQWRLADSYLGTRTQIELEALLERGGVVGGSSAGATIQGSYLARGDTAGNVTMMGDHDVGFGFLKNVAIDQHLLARNRQFDLIEIIDAKPELLGIGLDENTAIIVTGDRFEVMGEGYVAIYDHNTVLPNNGRFYLLSPGDRFDLGERRPLRQGFTSDEFGFIGSSE